MQRFRILVVANGPSEVSAIEKSLSRLKHAEVICVSSVMQALSRLGSMQVDLILCQIELPNMSGITLGEELQSKNDTKQIPIIYLSETYTNKHFLQMGYELGSFDYLRRPIKDDRLINKVLVYQKLFFKTSELCEAKRMISEVRHQGQAKESA